jgi:hypothetical protein
VGDGEAAVAGAGGGGAGRCGGSQGGATSHMRRAVGLRVEEDRHHREKEEDRKERRVARCP